MSAITSVATAAPKAMMGAAPSVQAPVSATTTVATAAIASVTAAGPAIKASNIQLAPTAAQLSTAVASTVAQLFTADSLSTDAAPTAAQLSTDVAPTFEICKAAVMKYLKALQIEGDESVSMVDGLSKIFERVYAEANDQPKKAFAVAGALISTAIEDALTLKLMDEPTANVFFDARPDEQARFVMEIVKEVHAHAAQSKVAPQATASAGSAAAAPVVTAAPKGITSAGSAGAPAIQSSNAVPAPTHDERDMVEGRMVEYLTSIHFERNHSGRRSLSDWFSKFDMDNSDLYAKYAKVRNSAEALSNARAAISTVVKEAQECEFIDAATADTFLKTHQTQQDVFANDILGQIDIHLQREANRKRMILAATHRNTMAAPELFLALGKEGAKKMSASMMGLPYKG
jgi:hypothetical protein